MPTIVFISLMFKLWELFCDGCFLWQLNACSPLLLRIEDSKINFIKEMYLKVSVKD